MTGREEVKLSLLLSNWGHRMHRRVRNVCEASLMFHLLFPGNVNMLLFYDTLHPPGTEANKYKSTCKRELPAHTHRHPSWHVVINCHHRTVRSRPTSQPAITMTIMA